MVSTVYGDDRKRPTHPDFPALVSAVLWLDAQSGPEAVASSLALALKPLTTGGVRAGQRLGEGLDAESPQGAVLKACATAWLEGFSLASFLPDGKMPEGREEDALETADRKRTTAAAMEPFYRVGGHEAPPALGADADSVAYMGTQRALRSTQSWARRGTDPRVAVAACWLEGFLAGVRFPMERASTSN